MLDLFLLFFTVLASGSLFFFVRNPSGKLLKLILAFSGAFLFAISVMHLMPEVYQMGGSNIGAWIMSGFLLQIVLEYFSEGIEHGHVHVHHESGTTFPLGMMISLSLHSFLEGLPLGTFEEGLEAGETLSHNHSLLYGIMLHHLPVAFLLVSMLQASGIGRSKTIFLLVIFAAMAPLGAVCGQLMHENAVSGIAPYLDKTMGIVIGIFLHISTTILFETGSDHRFNIYKMIVVITGALIGLVSFWH
jgi:zinc and cadmium transporter